MSFVTIRLTKELDEALQRVVPEELRGKRKAEIRVYSALREFLSTKGDAAPASKKRKAS